MDNSQKEILESKSTQLAELIDFDKLSRLIIVTGLVSKERIGEISTNKTNKFGRNLKLLNALQDSTCLQAFDKFLEILDITQHSEALKLINSTNKSDNRVLEPKIRKNLIQLYQTYSPNSSRPRFPLGVDSGSFNAFRGISNSGECLGPQDNASLSPLKEAHQATVIGSSQTYQTHTFVDGCRLGRRESIPFIDAGNSDGNPIRYVVDNNRSQASQHIPNSHRTAPNSSSLRMHDLRLSDSEEEAGQEPVVRYHPYAQIIADNMSAHGGSPTSQTSFLCISPSSDSDSSSDSATSASSYICVNNPNAGTIASVADCMMKIKDAKVIHNHPDEDYRMLAKVRGLCLIVNNEDFEFDILPKRHGSSFDATRFDMIFKELGFKVMLCLNLKADEMKKKFREVASICKKEHDALFIIVLSHGVEEVVYGADGLEVHLDEDIVTCFDNRNCTALIGKPKVFIFQACRGRGKDSGGRGDTTDSVAKSPAKIGSQPALATAAAAASRGDLKPTSSSQPPPYNENRAEEKFKRTKIAARTDMFLVFSCLPGYVSVRNELAGSWLGVALPYYMMEYAHLKSWQEILNFVAKDITTKESSEGHVQSTEFRSIGWSKNLYFNPGYYIEGGQILRLDSNDSNTRTDWQTD